MKVIAALSTALALSAALAAQDTKPVPKDSVRVFVPGCVKGAMFTTGRRTEDEPGPAVPEGTRLRMNGPKKLMSEIKAEEGTRIEITGLIKKGQYEQSGIRLGPGVRMSGGPTGGTTGSLGPNPVVDQIMIDVEGWRKVLGECPSH
jgi:hypothetical protein